MRVIRVLIFLILLAATAEAQSGARKAFEKGARAAIAGEYKRALTKYQKSLQQLQSANDSSTDLAIKVHYNLGVCFYHLDQFAEAIAEYSKAIELSGGKYQRAFRAQAMAYVSSKNRQAAKKAFNDALSLNERDGESWFDLAMILVSEKDYDQAAAAFEQAITNKTSSLSAAHNNFGVILALRHNFAAAEKEFETSLSESGNTFVTAKNNLEFCRSRGVTSRNLLAKLEFGVKE